MKKGILFSSRVFPLILFNVFIWALAISTVFFRVTDYPYGRYRHKVPSEDLVSFYNSGYSETFYNYAREVDIYYVDLERLGGRLREWDEKAGCSYYHDPLDPVIANRIYIFRDDTTCLFHEVGHHIDSKTDISDSLRFRMAVRQTLDDWEKIKNEGCPLAWCITSAFIADFPGIGREYSDGWGGYGELFAELFSAQSIEWIPWYLKPFYRPYLP